MTTVADEIKNYEPDKWFVWIKRSSEHDGQILTYVEEAPSIDAAIKKASRQHRMNFRENSFRIVLAAIKGLDGIS